MPGNQAWAGNAAALCSSPPPRPTATGRRLAWNRYDAGQAVAHLTVQAQAEGLVVHQMGGFDPAAAAAVFDLDAGVQPLVVVAVGHHDPAVVLPGRSPRASTPRASASPWTTCSSPPPGRNCR